MFLDASAIVGILAREHDSTRPLEVVEASSTRETSVVSLFEAVLGLSKTMEIAAAYKTVECFVVVAELDIVPIEAGLLSDLAQTHRRYGKGTGHPARLNMGDCYSYALAKRHGTSLLYKGEDFAKTDLA